MVKSIQRKFSLHPASCTPYPQRPRRGFTLVELLVVITIIGILAALITVAAIGALKKSRQAQIKAELNQIATAVDDYKNKTTAYPPNCQTDGPAANTLDEQSILTDLRRHVKQIAPRSQEDDALVARLAGLTTATPPAQLAGTGQLAGGMTADEAVVFWLGGFSPDPKYPISADGGPSYVITTIGDTANAKQDPIETRKFVFPFDVSRLGPRDNSGYFSGRYIEYTVTKNGLAQNRRINFWNYTPSKSDKPYLYFDTSRHPAGVVSGTSLLGTYDPPAATALVVPPQIPLAVYAFKKRAENASSTTTTIPQVQFVNPDKYQIIHCGLANAWDETNFKRMSTGLVATNRPDDYLLFPTGPFIGDIADAIVNFASETKIEDAQK
ncbi:MAG TPA: prepilin-type N-terminal cleavage/methylation domain-containing protein [Lacipirellulaceae bacterium]|nr:prepilin-type N-terminal cleavage/methylation domain-containing protein [Lacipirellulaceae bacterium]